MGSLYYSNSISFMSKILVLSILVGATTALSLPSWLSGMLPAVGSGSIQDNIKCYSLPYGGIGFLSHVLTFWTIGCLSIAKAPWSPIRQLSRYKLDLLLGLASVLFTIALSALAIIRCRRSWQFILIAAWKMSLSFTLGCCGIHRALYVRKSDKSERKETIALRWYGVGNYHTKNEDSRPSYAPAGWLVFYILGIAVGLVGLISIVVEAWPTRSKAIEIISEVFGTAVLLGIPIGICFHTFISNALVGICGAIGMIGILPAFYSDWILAAIAVQEGGDWAGTPSSDYAPLYWAYFAAKRLPFFSS